MTKVGDFLRKFKPKKIPSPIKKGGGIPAPSTPFRGFNPPTPKLSDINKNKGRINLRPPASRSGGSSRRRSSGGGSNFNSNNGNNIKKENEIRQAKIIASRKIAERIKREIKLRNDIIKNNKIKEFLNQNQKMNEIKQANAKIELVKLQQGNNFANRQRAIRDAERKTRLFQESQFKIAQAGVNSGRFTVAQANEMLLKSNIKINQIVNKELIKQVGKNFKKIKRKKISNGVRIGRNLTNKEKADLIKTTNLNIKQIENSVVVIRNGNKFIESPGFDFSIPVPNIPRGERASKFIPIKNVGQIINRELKKTIITSKIKSEKLKSQGSINKNIINKNKGLIKTLLKPNFKFDNEFSPINIRKMKRLRWILAGSTAETILLAEDFGKFIWKNNPARKQTRNDINKAVKKYIPKISKWTKEVITNKEKRKLVGLAIVGGVVKFGRKNLKTVLLDPEKAMMKVGTEFLMFEVIGSGLKLTGKLAKKITKGFVEVGGKIVKTSDVLTAISERGGKVVRDIEIIGNKLIIKTTKNLNKGKIFIRSVNKKLESKQIKKAISKALKSAEKKSGKKLTTATKNLIRKKVRDSFKITKLNTKQKSALKRALAQEDRLISGVRVGKKEFRSFQEGQKELSKIKKINKITIGELVAQGDGRIIKNTGKTLLRNNEKSVIETMKIVPKTLIKKASKTSVTTISQKFVKNIPTLKRFGSLKKGIWRIINKKRIFYLNSVSVTMFNRAGESIATFTFNTLANKPIKKFRTLLNVLKWGRNKSVTLSRGVGKNFVESFTFIKNGKKILKKEFISKFKITTNGKITRFGGETKEVVRKGTRKLKKRFIKGKTIAVSGGKVEESSITIKTIIDTAKINTSKIEKIVELYNNVKSKNLIRASRNRITQLEKILKKIKGNKKLQKEVKILINKIKKKEKLYLGSKKTIIENKRFDRRMKEIRRLNNVIKKNAEKKGKEKLIKRSSKKIKNLIPNKQLKTLREVERDLIREIKDAGKIIRKKTSKIKKFTKEEMKQLSKSKKRFKKKLKNAPRKFRNKIKQEKINRRKFEIKNRNKLNNIRKRKPLTQKQARENVRLRNIEIAKNTPKMSKFKQKKVNEVFKSLQKNKALRESLAGSNIQNSIRIPQRVEGFSQLRKLAKAEKELRRIARLSSLSRSEKLAVMGLIKILKRALALRKSFASVTTSKKAKSFITVMGKLQATAVKKIKIIPTKTIPKILPVIIPIIPTIINPKIPIIIPPIPPIKKKPPIRLRKKKKKDLNIKKLKKPVKVFNIVIKKRGKNITINRRLTLLDAKNYMAYELDTSLIRSAKLIPVGISKNITKLGKKYNGAFNKRKNKFRKFKIRNKKRIMINGYIEKKKYSLDTKREKKQLGRLIKKSRKRKINKRKNIKRIRRKIKR